MMVKLVYIWTGGISGEFTSTVDLYYNLQKYIDIEYYVCIERKEFLHSCIKLLIQNNNRDLLSHITLERIFEGDLIICTSDLLYRNIVLRCDNLFIVDSQSLKKHDYFLPTINNYGNIRMFSNPSNIKNDIPYYQIEYYHKFSEKRIADFPEYYKPYPYNKKVEPFIFDVFDYSRTKKPHLEIEDGIYFENIGKRIFEHLYHNKIVNYSCDGIVIPDGLFYYLNIFGIDGSKDHKPLLISKESIVDNLFMNSDDTLLSELGRIKCR